MRWLALSGVIAVVAGVENTVGAVVLHEHAARKNKLILLFIGAAWKRNPVVFIMYKIFCGRKMPSKGLTERGRISGIALMEKIERIMKTERHSITEPHARRLIKYILHKNLLVYWQTEDFLNKCKFSLCEK